MGLTSEAVCVVVPVAAITTVPMLSAGAYRHRHRHRYRYPITAPAYRAQAVQGLTQGRYLRRVLGRLKQPHGRICMSGGGTHAEEGSGEAWGQGGG